MAETKPERNDPVPTWALVAPLILLVIGMGLLLKEPGGVRAWGPVALSMFAALISPLMPVLFYLFIIGPRLRRQTPLPSFALRLVAVVLFSGVALAVLLLGPQPGVGSTERLLMLQSALLGTAVLNAFLLRSLTLASLLCGAGLGLSSRLLFFT